MHDNLSESNNWRERDEGEVKKARREKMREHSLHHAPCSMDPDIQGSKIKPKMLFLAVSRVEVLVPENGSALVAIPSSWHGRAKLYRP